MRTDLHDTKVHELPGWGLASALSDSALQSRHSFDLWAAISGDPPFQRRQSRYERLSPRERNAPRVRFDSTLLDEVVWKMKRENGKPKEGKA